MAGAWGGSGIHPGTSGRSGGRSAPGRQADLGQSPLLSGGTDRPPARRVHHAARSNSKRVSHAGVAAAPARGSSLRSARGVAGPMAAQARDEVGGALVGKEESRALDLDDFGDAGNGVAQPVCPTHAEEDVAGSPDDERGHGQSPQLVLYGDQV